MLRLRRGISVHGLMNLSSHDHPHRSRVWIRSTRRQTTRLQILSYETAPAPTKATACCCSNSDWEAPRGPMRWCKAFRLEQVKSEIKSLEPSEKRSDAKAPCERPQAQRPQRESAEVGWRSSVHQLHLTELQVLAMCARVA